MREQFDTPILFLIFNRPDTTQQVFNQIRKVKPKYLYVAADGPRLNNNQDIESCAQTRNIINQIDWDCEVKTLFRAENLGCRIAVSSAISWFFENVEQGIILEDDCLPDISFFRFCQELLLKYKNHEEVLSIGGFNRQKKSYIKEDYLFSRYFSSWGWATWDKAWSNIDIELIKAKEIIKNNELKKIYPNYYARLIAKKRLTDAINNKQDSWAIPWSWTHQYLNKYTIIPKKNLIENIGFSDDLSTHTKENKIDKIFLAHKNYVANFPLKQPKNINENKLYFTLHITREYLRVILKKIFS